MKPTKTQNTKSKTAAQIKAVAEALLDHPDYTSMMVAKLTGASDQMVIVVRGFVNDHRQVLFNDLVKYQSRVMQNVAKLEEVNQMVMTLLTPQQQLEAKAVEARFMADLVLD